MYELAPVVAGVMAGVVCQLTMTRWRWAWIAAFSVVIGVVAAFLAGELLESPLYILVDAPLAMAGAAIGAVAARLRTNLVAG